MAVTVTNSTIAKYNTEIVKTFNAATADTANGTEVFTITPKVSGNSIAIEISVADTNGAVGFSIAAGGLWGAGAAKTGSVAQATTEIIQIETGKYLKNDGTILLTLTPATGKKLLTDHAAKVAVIELA